MTFPLGAFCPTQGSVTVSYRTSGITSATGQTSLSLVGADLGTEANNRTIVVGVSYRGSLGSSRSVSSVAVAGISATRVTAGLSTADGAEIYVARVRTGSTGDVVISMSGTCTHITAVVWAAYNVNHNFISRDNASTNTNPVSATINIPAGGAAFAVAHDSGLTSGNTWSWSGLTEDVDSRDASTDTSYSGASGTTTTALNSLSVSATYSGTLDGGRLAVASFAPGGG